MSPNPYTFLDAIKETFLYAFASTATLLVILLDIVWFDANLSEYSLTEIGQEIMLTVILFTFFKLAWQYSSQRNAHLLIAGFFSCMLIRELDALFDTLVHGFWLYPALMMALLTIALTFIRQPKRTLQELTHFVNHRQHQYMVAGLICVLVFSRLFGMGLLWNNVLGDHYLRVVKNIAEEGPEFFGYALCFIATLLYRRSFLHDQNEN